jgi:RimJ/RimL family protein N-acetyltransferase
MITAMARIVLPAEPLRDGSTALRPWRDADIPSLVLACRDADIARWTLAPEHYEESDARAYMLQRLDATHAGVAAPFAIVDAEDDRVLLGSVSLLRLDWTHARGEVGYWLGAEARGQGHATRAVSLICAWGVRALGLERIVLLAATGNLPSQRVAERCGFRREAVLRSYMRGRGERHDMICYGWP